MQIINSSILDQPVDCIVNAANSFLRHGGGLARVIDDAAKGPFAGYMADECVEYARVPFNEGTQAQADALAVGQYLKGHEDAPLIATGDAYATSAGLLPFKHVIHAVSPIWKDGTLREADLLAAAYKAAFEIAIDLGHKAIAVPALGMGIFGMPPEIVALASTLAARKYSHRIDTTICLTNDEDVALFRKYERFALGMRKSV